MKSRNYVRAGQVLSGLLVVAGLIVVAHLLPRISSVQDTVRGHARIIDGDSLHVGGEVVRLKGLDAPELSQTCRIGGRPWPCGQEARKALAVLTRGKEVVCRIEGRDRYGRALGRCRAGGTDINETLVREGWAVAYGDYMVAEARAAAGAKGIWRGEFDAPRDHRAGHSIYGWLAGLKWPWE